MTLCNKNALFQTVFLAILPTEKLAYYLKNLSYSHTKKD